MNFSNHLRIWYFQVGLFIPFLMNLRIIHILHIKYSHNSTEYYSECEHKGLCITTYFKFIAEDKTYTTTVLFALINHSSYLTFMLPLRNNDSMIERWMWLFLIIRSKHLQLIVVNLCQSSTQIVFFQRSANEINVFKDLKVISVNRNIKFLSNEEEQWVNCNKQLYINL